MIFNSYNDIVNNVYSTFVCNINACIGSYINISVNKKHLLDRMNQRDIDITIVAELLNTVYKKHLCELLYLTQLEEHIRPFRIELKNNEAIVVLSRINEYNWKINTVLDPSMHSKHNDKPEPFYRRINL